MLPRPVVPNRRLFGSEKRPYWWSVILHLILLAIIITLAYYKPVLFHFGSAVKSPQQVQIVNATLILSTPSVSKVITPTPPAPAPLVTQPKPVVTQSKPVVKPAPPQPKEVHEIIPKPAPQTPKLVKQGDMKAQAEAKKQQQEQQAQQQVAQQQAAQRQTAQRLKALQALKALGMNSIQQTVKTDQLEAASAAQQQEDLTLKQKYMGLIQQTIRSNWINQFDPSLNITVILKLQLDKSGKILSVAIVHSSGNPTFDRQAVLAVKKSSPLPMPPIPALAEEFSNLTLPFNNQAMD